MRVKTRAVTVAVAGTVAGVTGLAVLAMPAGAGEAPELPPISAQALVESALTAQAPALSGTIAVDNHLGLPAAPGMTALNADSARVFYDGAGHSRLAAQQDGTEFTVVRGSDAVWLYDSSEREATRVPLTDMPEHAAGTAELADPAALTTRLLDEVRQSSTVAVDGTATVADRAAYELVLTPKPDERTLLREVRVAVDSETRLPLRLSVFTHGTTEPAVQVGFTDISFGAQPAELFRFTPPRGATVTEEAPSPSDAQPQPDPAATKVVGEGWDTVLVSTLPTELRSAPASGDGTDPQALLRQLGKPVTGSYGSGYLITTTAATALVTDDGRVAVGAVPEQVLEQALGSR